MSQKHLPRRVDFTPTSGTPTQPTADQIVMVTGEAGRLVDAILSVRNIPTRLWQSTKTPGEHPAVNAVGPS